VSAALFQVDTAIVGPAAGEITSFGMGAPAIAALTSTSGEKWFIAGFWLQEQLTAAIRTDEVATLQRLAARPALDFQLSRPHVRTSGVG